LCKGRLPIGNVQKSACSECGYWIRRSMRLDKYIKVSRLIKRRTVAKSACDAGRVYVNDKQAKAGTEIKIGDIITIGFGDKQIKVRVTEIAETVKKDEAKEMYEFVE